MLPPRHRSVPASRCLSPQAPGVTSLSEAVRGGGCRSRILLLLHQEPQKRHREAPGC